MSDQATLVKRADHCKDNNLCFVSLKKWEKENATIIKHSVVGDVVVINDYLNPKPKVVENAAA